MATAYTKVWNEDVVGVLADNIRDEFSPSFNVYFSETDQMAKSNSL